MAEDTASISSATSSLEDECDDDLTTDGVVLAREAPSFGTVSVNNSTDIHFGNKTFYNGPVTIKQIVYANGREEIKVPGLEPSHRTLPDDVPASKAVSGHNQEDLESESHQALKLCLGKATKKRHLIVWLVTLSVSIVLVTSLTLILVLVTRPDMDGDDPTNVTLSGKLRILERKDWLAQPPTKPLDALKLPVPYVIISHTASEPCYKQAQCVFIVRHAQTFHIEGNGWSDIGYNFLVGGDGYAYTGRGWDSVGAHAFGYNICSIGISFIGTFNTVHPPDKQFLAATQLIEEGVRLGKISRDYRVLAHRQVSATESPGQALFLDIRELPQWLVNPASCKDVARNTTSSTPHLTTIV